MSDVTIAGKKVPRWAAIAAGAGSLVAVYIVYKNHQSAAQAPSPSAATTGTDGSSLTDPYGLASTGTGGGYGTYPVYSGPTQVGTTSSVNYPDNATWAQAAEAGLSSVGYAPVDVAAALGRYLAHLSVTSAQATIIYAALAEYGPPPSGSYQVILQPSGGTTSTPPPAKAPSSAPSLSASPHAGAADFGWSTVSGATSYELLVTGAGGKGTGTSHVDSTVTGNHAEHVALAQGAYVAKVRARNSAGAGPYSATRKLTVTK